MENYTKQAAVVTDQVTAALIAAVVAAAGVLASVLASRRDTDARTRELAASIDRLAAEQETVRQEQLTEILRKRIETYPALWEIITIYGRNWEIEGKPCDQAWAKTFLKALIDNNAKHGAFFSNAVYAWYGALRSYLEEMTVDLATGRTATPDEIARLYDIIRGPVLPTGDKRGPGLGSYIKDELGSYVTLIVSAMHPHEKRRAR